MTEHCNRSTNRYDETSIFIGGGSGQYLHAKYGDEPSMEFIINNLNGYLKLKHNQGFCPRWQKG